MAVKKNKVVEEVLVVDEVEITEEEVTIEEEVVIEHEEVAVPEKRVKVLLADNHKCSVGGEWYYFQEGKVYSVPENVKIVLMRAGKLAPM